MQGGKAMTIPKKSVAELFPHLKKEFHPTLNGSMTIYDVTPGMHIEIWWICKVDPSHIWPARVYNRARVKNPRGCPHCSNQVLNETNCLANANADLAKEWCYELNGPLTPNDVQAGGKQVVWWECQNKHRWQAQIYERNKGRQNCKECCSLAFLYPELLEDWDYQRNEDIDPQTLHYQSHNMVYWKCSRCQNEWQSMVSERVKGHKTCMNCRSIVTTHREIAKEWHPTLNGDNQPNEVSYGSNQLVYWQCQKKQEHIWYETVNSRTSRVNGCIYCSKGRSTSVPEMTLFFALREGIASIQLRKKLTDLKIEADLSESNLKLALEFDSFRFHKDKIEDDERKNEAFTDFYFIRIREHPLPEILRGNCINIEYKKHSSYNDLERCYREIISQLEDWYPNSQLIDFRKLIKVDISAKIREAIQFLSIVPEEESLALNKPHLIDEWHQEKNDRLTPWDVRTFCNERVWWKCKECDHVWPAQISKRSLGRGCPKCNGRGSAMVIDETNSLASLFPKIAAQLHPNLNENIDPNKIYAFSTKSYWFVCDVDINMSGKPK
jgi:hypothetical protein